MGEILGAVLALMAFGAVVVLVVSGPGGFRRMFDGALSRRNDRWASGLPANLLLIVTTVMFALETGVASGGAGSGLAAMLILGSAVLIAVAPNIASVALGILGLCWAVPKMIGGLGAEVVLPILLLSLLGAALAGILARG